MDACETVDVCGWSHMPDVDNWPAQEKWSWVEKAIKGAAIHRDVTHVRKVVVRRRFIVFVVSGERGWSDKIEGGMDKGDGEKCKCFR